MQIMIEISKENYKSIKERVDRRDYPDMETGRAIRNGTPLPKGHGRLVEVDKIGLSAIEIIMCDGSYKEALLMLINKIEDAPTIIEADKEDIKMREATPEERESIDKYIKSNSKATGVNFWDSYEDSYKEHCDDAISRQAVLDVIRKCHCEEWIKADIGASIDALPSVKPQEPKTGHWIEYDHGLGCKYYQCSICKGFDRDEKGKYCKWCGRKMVSQQESEEEK